MLTAKHLEAHGWTRTDTGPTKLVRRYQHRDGWVLQHCGHATAVYPWMLYDPHGRMHMHGAMLRGGDPTRGVCWRRPADAIAYVHSWGRRGMARIDRLARTEPAVLIRYDPNRTSSSRRRRR